MHLPSCFGRTLLLLAGSAVSSHAQTTAPTIERLQFSAVQVTADQFQTDVPYRRSRRSVLNR